MAETKNPIAALEQVIRVADHSISFDTADARAALASVEAVVAAALAIEEWQSGEDRWAKFRAALAPFQEGS